MASASIQTKAAPEPNGKSWFTTSASKLPKVLIQAAVLIGLWFTPAPQGVTRQAWHVFAIFAFVIVGLLLQPMPNAAILFVAVTLGIATGTLTDSMALSGFANTTVWLIFSAFIFSIGFLSTGLGRRIAYHMIRLLGGSTLGLAYAFSFTDLVFSPMMPSGVARSGGMILPVLRSLNEALDSTPGPTGAKLGNFLIFTCFIITTITGAISMTGMAANPLAAELARKTINANVTWLNWFVGASVPCLVGFLTTPYFVYKLTKPTVTRTPGAREFGRQKLAGLGRMSWREKVLAVVFFLALAGWVFGERLHLSPTAVAIIATGLLLASGCVEWKAVLRENMAWDTLIWFGFLLGLATALNDLQFMPWLAGLIGPIFHGWNWLAGLLALALVYVYLHYGMASATPHVVAFYAPFCAAAVSMGAPPLMVAILFGILSNLDWGLTAYGGGSGPVYFGQGYFDNITFMKLGLIVTTTNVVLMLAVGLAWWKVLGWW
jgi:DASS family divalent anion:Na+ symporter